MNRFVRLLLCVTLVGCWLPVAFRCSGGEKAAAAAERLPTAGSSLEGFIGLFQNDSQSVLRFYELPYSTNRSDRLQRLYSDWQQKLAEVQFNSLEQQGRIDYVLLRNRLTADLAELDQERRRLAEMEELLAWRSAVQDLEWARFRMEPLNPAAAAEVVARLPAQFKDLKKRLEKGKSEEKKKGKHKEPPGAVSGSATNEMSEADEQGSSGTTNAAEKVIPLTVTPVVAKRAAAAVDELRRTLESWYSFYDGYQPDFSWWLKKPYEEANHSLEDYSKFLREQIAGLKGKDEDPLLGEPIGAEMLAKALAAEMLPYTAEELIAIGEKEFAWCEAEMKKAAAAMACGGDWKAALAKVKADYAAPGHQDDLVTTYGREAIQFVKEHDLVTVPPLCEETWRLTMLSPERQKMLPFAAYGGQGMLVAYAKDEMKQEDKVMTMRGNNRHFTRIVIPHELIPGHHLQSFESARHYPYRRMFGTPFLVEGWALYWELKLWDLGYARTPEDRIGMLFWRMHRCARIIVSLKFHLGQMKPEEMVDFLVDRVGHERLGATSEVRRFIGSGYSPEYQCGYMIGGMQLRALHQELVGAGKMTERQFNDTVLTYGPIPIELIRDGMMNVALTRDARPEWRFAGEKPGTQ
jgi:uncharacterized protein (DUF885 family)